ncbi:hypothetical protein LguiB_030532 [Lonicera macranthoides]
MVVLCVRNHLSQKLKLLGEKTVMNIMLNTDKHVDQLARGCSSLTKVSRLSLGNAVVLNLGRVSFAAQCGPTQLGVVAHLPPF